MSSDNTMDCEKIVWQKLKFTNSLNFTTLYLELAKVLNFDEGDLRLGGSIITLVSVQYVFTIKQWLYFNGKFSIYKNLVFFNIF